MPVGRISYSRKTPLCLAKSIWMIGFGDALAKLVGKHVIMQSLLAGTETFWLQTGASPL